MNFSRRQYVIPALLASLCLFPLVSIASETDSVIDKIEASFRNTRAMTASFTQVMESKGLGQVIEKLSGKMYMVKPSKMRWEYANPKGRLMVVDGKRLWFYDPKENVTRYDDLAGLLSPDSPALFLAGDAALRDIFTVELVKPGKKDTLKTIKLRLTPKEPQPGLKAMALVLDSVSLDIVELLMVDHLGNRNRIKFYNIDRNADPDRKLFQFTPPEGSPVRAIGEPLGK